MRQCCKSMARNAETSKISATGSTIDNRSATHLLAYCSENLRIISRFLVSVFCSTSANKRWAMLKATEYHRGTAHIQAKPQVNSRSEHVQSVHAVFEHVRDEAVECWQQQCRSILSSILPSFVPAEADALTVCSRWGLTPTLLEALN